MIGRAMPQTCFGFKVYVSPDEPKMQLSARVCEVLTPAQVADHNAWLAGFFGTTNLLPDGQYIVSEVGGFVTMNPRTYANFRAAMQFEVAW